MKTIIKKLVELGTRQGRQAKEACKYLRGVFELNKVDYKVEEYQVDMPVWKKCVLKADGVDIPCVPTGLTSGYIKSAAELTNSLVSSRQVFDTPHINFNPVAVGISRPNLSNAPSLTVSPRSVSQICGAQKILGQIIVKKEKQTTYQILVGNRKDPKNIVFTHFDSIGKGAIDNASGTVLAAELLVSEPQLLKDTLFVFDGNEEISYDNPVYWGKGYRNFEKKYSKQMAQVKQLLVVDCVGYAKTQIILGKSGAGIIKLAFPIKNIEKFSSKIKLITSDYDKLMTVYHSDADDGKNIQSKFLKEATRLLKDLLC